MLVEVGLFCFCVVFFVLFLVFFKSKELVISCHTPSVDFDTVSLREVSIKTTRISEADLH